MKASYKNNYVSRITALALAIIALTAVTGCALFADARDEQKGIQIDALKPATGFRVQLLAKDLPKARQLALGSRDTLFVGSNDGSVYALTMAGTTVTKQRTILSGITSPSGVAFYGGALFVSARTKILRFNS